MTLNDARDFFEDHSGYCGSGCECEKKHGDYLLSVVDGLIAYAKAFPDALIADDDFMAIHDALPADIRERLSHTATDDA